MNALFTLERVSDPEIEVFTLDQMKLYLRMFAEQTDDDADVTELIKGAREWVEDYTSRALVDQRWRLTILGPTISGDFVRGFVLPVSRPGYSGGPFILTPIGDILLRRSPVLSIVSIKVRDGAGTETTVDPATYEVREAASKYPRLFPLNNATWFTGGILGGDLKIDFRAGFADRDSSPVQGAEAVPVLFKRAMKLWMEAHYDRDSKSFEMMLQIAQNMVDTQRANFGGVA